LNTNIPISGNTYGEKREWEYPGYIVYQQLIDTRPWWNDQLIEEFLKAPDLTAPNPHNCEQTMRLYLLDKVQLIEQQLPYKQRCLELNRKKFTVRNFVIAEKRLQREQNQANKKKRLEMRDATPESILETIFQREERQPLAHSRGKRRRMRKQSAQNDVAPKGIFHEGYAILFGD
jgi:hypothetical protein